MVRDCPTLKHFNPRTPRGVRHGPVGPFRLFCDFNPRTPRGVRLEHFAYQPERCYFNPRTPRGVRRDSSTAAASNTKFQSTHPARGATLGCFNQIQPMSDFNPRTPRGVRPDTWGTEYSTVDFNPRTPRGVRLPFLLYHRPTLLYFNPRTPRGVRLEQPGIGLGHLAISIHAPREGCDRAMRQPSHLPQDFNPRTPRGVRQQTLPKSREFAWLNLLICTRGRRLSIQKQTRLCSIKLSFMLFGCEPAGEGVSSWTSHATKSKVRLEGRSAYSQSARSSAHSDFPGNKSGGCPVRDP